MHIEDFVSKTIHDLREDRADFVEAIVYATETAAVDRLRGQVIQIDTTIERIREWAARNSIDLEEAA